MDTALLMAGFLSAAMYFDGDAPEERENPGTRERTLRARSTGRGCSRPTGHCPTDGSRAADSFTYGYKGYSEALLLYVLALGSPTHPIPPERYDVLDVHVRVARALRARLPPRRPAVSRSTSSRTAGSTSGTSRTPTCAERASDYF
jgi:hypothetical protein